MEPEIYFSHPINDKDTNLPNPLLENFLYYARLIDPNMLHAINEISWVQSKPRKETLAKERMLLDYDSTQLNDILGYHDSQMILHIESDAEKIVMT